MSKAPPKKLYRVELFVEVPNSLTPPDKWDWNLMLNGTRPHEGKTPVTFVLAQETVEGTA